MDSSSFSWAMGLELNQLCNHLWESANILRGPVDDYCRDHSRDLEILATVTEIQYDILEEGQAGRAAPPEVPFPWGSFEELHHRAEEVRLAHSS